MALTHGFWRGGTARPKLGSGLDPSVFRPAGTCLFGLFYAFKVTIAPKTTPGENLTSKQKWAFKIAEIWIRALGRGRNYVVDKA